MIIFEMATTPAFSCDRLYLNEEIDGLWLQAGGHDGLTLLDVRQAEMLSSMLKKWVIEKRSK
jgi:hypothetical protein